MKNILNIDINTTGNCTCFENIDDASNKIILRFKRNNPINPKIKIIVGYNDENSTEYPLAFVDGIAIYELSVSLFNESTLARFQFLDDDYTGAVFSISCLIPNKEALYKTLILFKVSEYSYVARMITTVDLSMLEYDDDDFIIEDGTLSIKKGTEKMYY